MTDQTSTSRPLPTRDAAHHWQTTSIDLANQLAAAGRQIVTLTADRDRATADHVDTQERLHAATTAITRIRAGLETVDRALAAYDDTDPDDQDRPECTALCRDVEADRDALQDAIDRADSVRIDGHDRIWRPAPDGCWQRPLYGHWTLAAITQQHGPTRAAWLIHLNDDQDDDRDPTVAERLATTAHAAQDVADQLEQAEADLAHVGQVLTDWRASFNGEPAHEADRVLADLIDGGLLPTAGQPMPPVAVQSAVDPATTEG